MSKSDPKDKDKQEQEKTAESTPPIPERPEPNTTIAQKSLNEGTENESGSDNDGETD